MADEPRRDPNDGSLSQRLTEQWRADPKGLREAVRSAREAYQRTPKAARRLPDAACLVGESKGGTVLYGLVVADAARAGEFYAELQETAVHIKSHAHRREARIQVFVPPDWPHESPTSIAGVRVDWFRWVPVSEEELRVEKLGIRSGATAGPALPGESVIAKLLGHLKWLAEMANAAPYQKPPIGWAFRVYSGAVQLAFHTSFTPDAQAIIATSRGRKFTAALDSLVTAGMKTTKPLRTPGGLAAARDTTIRNAERDELIEAAEKVFKHALKSGLVGDITAERQRDFEAAPDVAALLRALPGDGKSAEERHRAATAALQGDPELADLCRAIAGVVAARSPMVTGEVRPAIHAAAQEMATGFLGVAVEHLPKRHKVIGKAAGTLVKALTALSSEDAGPA